MPVKCVICGKTSTMVWKRVKLRGKYNPTVKNRKYPNLQWTRLADGKGTRPEQSRRVKACAKCIKAMAKTK